MHFGEFRPPIARVMQDRAVDASVRAMAALAARAAARAELDEQDRQTTENEER